MIPSLSFFQGDVALAHQLLEWMHRLGGCETFEILLVADGGTPFDQVIRAKELAEHTFKSVHIVASKESVISWPKGCNSNWRTAMKWASEHKQDIAFIETDAIPLKASWLKELDTAWNAVPEGTNYLGSIEPSQNVQLPPLVISGVGIYSHRVGAWALSELGRPWNVDWSDLLIPHGVKSHLIRDFFGTKELPPVFVDVASDKRMRPNELILDWIDPKAVIFHRDKTHSLIPLLAKRLGVAWEPARRKIEPMAVVFPVHRGDIHLAQHHSLWLLKLGRQWNHTAFVAYDPTLGDALASQLAHALRDCFSSVELMRYSAPPIPTYPATANWAFQSVALMMAQRRSPWLWMEADAVVLKSDWLDQLQVEYEQCGKSFMGPLVHQMGHLQGTSVYPADTAQRMPRLMSCGAHEAFDMAGKEDMGDDKHDCGHLYHHVWSILNDAPCPVGGGTLPGDLTADQARRWLPREAVVTHRWKTRALIDLLLTGQYKHE